MFDEKIDEIKDEMIDTLKDLISYPSVSEETDNPNMPFGINCKNVLERFLEIATNMGFRTKNVDNYCGYVEFGEGEELVGILGHLDVVPALEEDGWTTPPFTADIRDGKLYGRGSIDDKGPVIASLYAMKTIMDNFKISKRVRLFVGLNEEKGWKCMNHYKEVEEWPSIGFSPDANFPGIYAEKGIMTIELAHPIKISNFDIINIDYKNNAINVVPKYCSITLKANNNAHISSEKTIENISITALDNDLYKIESFGTASHASLPQFGDNAIKRLVEYLLSHFEFDNNYLSYIYNNGFFDIESPRLLSSQAIEDESGILTSNVAHMDYDGTNLSFKTNLRVPVTYSLDDIKKMYEVLLNEFPDIKIEKSGIQEPLHVDRNSNLVKTLVEIFNRKAGYNLEPIAIGGGTYARAFKNVISYGANFPGDKDMCHQVDEFIYIDKFITSAKIYAEAIYELSK